MKKNTRQALISTLIFIPLFVLFQLWGNSGAEILHTISQAKFWIQLLITGGNLLLRTSLPTTHFSS